MLAAVTTLTVWRGDCRGGLIGGSLSEITSAGFIYLGAFMALRSRRGSLLWAVAAGLLASLAFYTRLNNLPMAAAESAVCALGSRAISTGSSNCDRSGSGPASPIAKGEGGRMIVAHALAVPAVLGLGLDILCLA